MVFGQLFRSHCFLRLPNRNYSRAVTSSAKLTPETDAQAISLIRGLAMDAPLYAKSGHQGTAMALAPLAHVLYSRVLRHAPQNSGWRNRDRFILSNGHASILQYAMLFLNGYGLEMEDIKAFRQWESQTPGHPEVGHTNGVEVTTGPFGQGFANAVGMAIAERNLRERFGADLMDHHTFVLAGDGCFMEGISHEAASLAGHLGLDRLVCVFDDNGITIDGSTTLTCSDDVAKRFASYGWNVIQGGEIGEDLDALEAMLSSARNHTRQPTLCILKTHIPTSRMYTKLMGTHLTLSMLPRQRPSWVSQTKRFGLRMTLLPRYARTPQAEVPSCLATMTRQLPMLKESMDSINVGQTQIVTQ